MSANFAKLASTNTGLRAEVEELRKERDYMSSASELEESQKQVDLLQEQLEEQQRASEK